MKRGESRPQMPPVSGCRARVGRPPPPRSNRGRPSVAGILTGWCRVSTDWARPPRLLWRLAWGCRNRTSRRRHTSRKRQRRTSTPGGRPSLTLPARIGVRDRVETRGQGEIATARRRGGRAYHRPPCRKVTPSRSSWPTTGGPPSRSSTPATGCPPSVPPAIRHRPRVAPRRAGPHRLGHADVDRDARRVGTPAPGRTRTGTGGRWSTSASCTSRPAGSWRPRRVAGRWGRWPPAYCGPAGRRRSPREHPRPRRDPRDAPPGPVPEHAPPPRRRPAPAEQRHRVGVAGRGRRRREPRRARSPIGRGPAGRRGVTA
jgi:hypothetical protein